MTKIDHLFVDKHPKVLQSSEHQPHITVEGYDQPPDYFAECSCGWSGRVFVTYVPNWPYPKYIQKFVDIFGPEALLPPDNLYGTLRDSQRELLEHLGLPLDKLVTEKIEKGQSKAFHSGDDPLASAVKLGKLAKEVQWLLAARELLESTPRAERAKPFNREVYEAYRELTKSNYANPMEKLDMQKLEAHLAKLEATLKV